MSRDVRMLERLGGELQSGFIRKLDAGQRQSQKNSVRAFVAAGRRARLGPALRVIAVAAGIALVLLAGALALNRAGRQDFSGVDYVSSGPGGLGFETPPGSGLRMSFKDGSTIDLGAGTRGSIREAGEKSVRIVLENGSLLASVKKGTGVRWGIEAGSYTVTVHGTKFRVAWDEAEEVMDLHVEEGKVLVRGGGIEAKGIGVVSGNHLRADRKKKKVTIEPCEKKHDAGKAQAPLPASQETQTVVEGQEEESTDLGGALGRCQKEWKLLIKQGKYSEAMKVARKAGIEKLTLVLSLTDLWQLAGAARYAEDAEAARKILLAVRDRFAKTPKAKIAAFLLGKVAVEMEKRPAEGAVWFKVYLQEDPGGPLAEEALGRLADAYADCGRKEDAGAAARKYLEKYPDGIFADMARKLVTP
jgi:transmembrane sensor